MQHISMDADFVFSPQPMYMIGTNNENGTNNFCVITWLGFSADDGPCLMMTIGGKKLTKDNILREGKFSANMITEDNLWLADYFGTTRGEIKEKNALPYTVRRGEKVDVPVLEDSHWIYECEAIRHVLMKDADLFIARIRNIQVDREWQDMDMQHIDLSRIRPVVYSPYQYFGIGEKLGEMGEWKKHYSDASQDESGVEKAK